MKFLLLGKPYFRRALQALGHEVITALQSDIHTPPDSIDIPIDQVPVSIHGVLEALPTGWRPDLIMLGDQSTFPQFLGLEFLDIPLAWYAVDNHLHGLWHSDYSGVFDLIFVAQRDYQANYLVDPGRQQVNWLPLFASPQRDRWLDLPPSYDISFVGALDPQLNPERVRFIDALQERTPLHVAQGDYVEIFNRSLMTLNQSVNNDVNFRAFEAMACGPLLLMERTENGLEDLFQDGVHLALFDRGDINQAAALFNHFYSRPDERAAIALRGRREVETRHLDIHRAQALLDCLNATDLAAACAARRQPEMLSTIQRRQIPVLERAAEIHLHFAQTHAETDPERGRRIASQGLVYAKVAETLRAKFG